MARHCANLYRFLLHSPFRSVPISWHLCNYFNLCFVSRLWGGSNLFSWTWLYHTASSLLCSFFTKIAHSVIGSLAAKFAAMERVPLLDALIIAEFYSLDWTYISTLRLARIASKRFRRKCIQHSRPAGHCVTEIDYLQKDSLSGVIRTHHLQPVPPFSLILGDALSLLRHLLYSWTRLGAFFHITSTMTPYHGCGTDIKMAILPAARESSRWQQRGTICFFVDTAPFSSFLDTQARLLKLLQTVTYQRQAVAK